MKSTANPNPEGLTLYSRIVLFGLFLPLLFIAGIQLFVFSEKTDMYFAWTFASAVPAAYLGAGYWSAMFHTYSGARARDWAFVRTSMPAALTATTMLGVTTFLHLDKFHLGSPLLITRLVTWVWIAVYVTVPFILVIAMIIQGRLPGAHDKGKDPLPAWMRGGFVLLALFALACGLGLFLAPQAMSSVWPWAVTPLAARAVSSWLTAFGVACAALTFENDIRNGAGTSSSLLAFCILEFIVLARYLSAIDWGKPLTVAYLFFLIIGMVITGSNLLANRRLSK